MIGYGGTAFLLLSAAVGYWVLERASTQKKNLKLVGQIVGTLIIVASFVGVACKTCYFMKVGKGLPCPFSAQQPSVK